MKNKILTALLGSMIATALVISASVAAATRVVVTPPLNSGGWSTADTRPGGAVNFVADSTAPAGNGALQLTTDATTTAKAQYMYATNTPILSVSELSYWTKQVSASFAQGDPSYQLVTCLGGVVGTTCTGFTTFVFEPYQNNGSAPPSPLVIPNVWQQWDVDAGRFWSSRNYTNGTCSVTAGAGGPPFYSLSDIQNNCPNAVVVGFGVNVGSNNPSYDVYTDLVNFNGTEYDFEPYRVPTARDDCKNDGWRDLRRDDGSTFKNQGDCIQYVNTGR
jgi:hypothetical protein